MESIIKNILNNFERISYVGCEESGEGGLYSASVDYITTTFGMYVEMSLIIPLLIYGCQITSLMMILINYMTR